MNGRVVRRSGSLFIFSLDRSPAQIDPEVPALFP